MPRILMSRYLIYVIFFNFFYMHQRIFVANFINNWLWLVSIYVCIIVMKLIIKNYLYFVLSRVVLPTKLKIFIVPYLRRYKRLNKSRTAWTVNKVSPPRLTGQTHQWSKIRWGRQTLFEPLAGERESCAKMEN